MTVNLNQLSIHKVAIVDDDQQNAESLGIIVETCGGQPFPITENFTDLNELVKNVRTNYDGVLCDHRLGHRTKASFTGAEAVARWFDLGFPAILVSEYTDFDTNTTIRRWRRKIPVAIPRDIFDIPRMFDGFSICRLESENKVPSFRKPHRAIVRVVALEADTDMPVVEAFVPQWNPRKAVRFPRCLLDKFEKTVKPNMLFIAKVNIGARSAEELFFEDFVLAPEPDEKDGLA